MLKKRIYTSPLEGTFKRINMETDEPIHNSHENDGFKRTGEDSNKDHIEELNVAISAQCEEQAAEIAASSILSKESKELALVLINSMAPLVGAMGKILLNKVTDCNKDKCSKSEMKSYVNQELETNNVRLQTCMIEQFYKMDKQDCRNRFRNLRISGLSSKHTSDPKVFCCELRKTTWCSGSEQK